MIQETVSLNDVFWKDREGHIHHVRSIGNEIVHHQIDTVVILPPLKPWPWKQRYLYRWNRQGRKGQECVLLCRGTMNSCLVEFADGYRMVTSRNALKRA